MDACGDGGCFGLIGSHPATLDILDAIRRAARAPGPVLVEGETGTGKELAVRALHVRSGARGRLVAENVACLVPSLAESELFGCVRGAYTGAVTRAGLIAAARDGTLYLDEAAELTAALQVKLLRVIETGLVRRVGAAVERRIPVRVVLSVQQPVDELVRGGRWRTDFYYRVAGVTLRLPPLRARASDVPLLVNHYLRRYGQAPLPPGALRVLEDYPWPGNLREVIRVVERALVHADAGPVAVHHLWRALDWGPRAVGGGERRDDVQPSLRAVTDAHLAAVVRAQGGDTAAAARVLGLSRSQVYRRLAALRAADAPAAPRIRMDANGLRMDANDATNGPAGGPAKS
ncbi:MAG: sigma 54-interacting transcriptional regulator [Gemmatimonadales bacterium]